MSIHKNQKNDVQRTWGYTVKGGCKRRAGNGEIVVGGARCCGSQGLFLQGLERESLYFEQDSHTRGEEDKIRGQWAVEALITVA